ncbi:unnamed protein product, partial [Rotaria sp. Silwood2]
MNITEETQKIVNALTSGEYVKAAEIYSVIINTAKLQNTPDVPALLASRASCYLLSKQWQLGLNDCNEAILINPHTINAYVQKGKILVELKKIDEARQVVKDARALLGEHQLLVDLDNIINDSWFTV